MDSFPSILTSKQLKEVLDRRLRYAQDIIAKYWKNQGKKNQHYISVEAVAQLLSTTREEIFRKLNKNNGKK